MGALLEARGLTRSYGEGSARMEVLHGVELTVERGEFVAIMGPSGSGKSTLLNALAGLDRPTSGEVWLDGRRVDTMSEAARARFRRTRVGFVFQSFQPAPHSHHGGERRAPTAAGRTREADGSQDGEPPP
jgi:putative ABC transport system ATP-binding protein